jgi:RNA polymerase sigma-70 factor, ECF subfamily
MGSLWTSGIAVTQESSDEALCRRVAAGNDAAFDLLVARHQGRAYRLAWSLLRDAEDARDASQEAFLRVYRTVGSFRGDARFSTWFYRILVNLCLDHRRRGNWWRRLLVRDDGAGAPEGAILDRQPAPVADPADRIERAQTTSRLWSAVDRLTPQQRAVIVLHVQEELPTSQIAAVLGCSEATVRVHLHRAVTTLRGVVRRD